MKVDIADDYPLNRTQRKRKIQDIPIGISKVPRKNDNSVSSELKRPSVWDLGESDNSLSKEMNIDINKRVILPNKYNRKRQPNASKESGIPQKIQVVDQVWDCISFTIVLEFVEDDGT